MEDVLDDAGLFWVNGVYLSAGSFCFMPVWFSKNIGWSGLLKGATSVVVCTAILWAARRCFRQIRPQQQQLPVRNGTLPNGIPLPNGTSTPATGRRRRLVVTPSNTKRSPLLFRHNKSQTSQVAIVSFADSDSETDTETASPKPQLDLEVIPVKDEVEREADDESSEMEENSSLFQVMARDVHDGDTPSSHTKYLRLGESAEPEEVEEVSEFCLTFESDSTLSEPESTLLVETGTGSKKNARVIMDMDRNGHVPTGFVDKEDGLDQSSDQTAVEGQKISFDKIKTSVEKDDDSSDVVVTRAVVSLA